MVSQVPGKDMGDFFMVGSGSVVGCWVTGRVLDGYWTGRRRSVATFMPPAAGFRWFQAVSGGFKTTFRPPSCHRLAELAQKTCYSALMHAIIKRITLFGGILLDFRVH